MDRIKPNKRYYPGPEKNPVSRTEEFYYSHLLLHVPRAEEKKLLDGYPSSQDC